MEVDDVIIKWEPEGDRECSVQLKQTEAASSSIYKDLLPSSQLSLKDTEKVESTSKEAEEMESIKSIKTKSERAEENVTSSSSTSPQEILSCTVCPQTFSLILDFKKHMRSHTFEVLHDCHLCSESFETPKDLKRHIKYHDADEPRRTYKCEICSQILSSTKSLRTHKLIHSGEKPFECETCGAQFRHRAAILRHGWQHVNTKNKDKKGKKKCSFCPKTFPTSTQLKNHEAIHTGERNYACPSCPKAFINLTKLKKHIRTHTGERPYKCPLCSLTFIDKYHVDRHQRVHTGEKPFCCSICKRCFVHKEEFEIHSKTLHVKGEDGKYALPGPVTCTVCSKVLQNEYNLQKHMKRHNGDGKPTNKCGICNVFIISKTKFERHMNEGLHHLKGKNRIRRYKCELCPAAFKDKRVLERHIRLHTGERPFECSICGRKFNSKYAVDRHMGTRHPDKEATNVRCHICSKTFSNYAKLKAHAEKHETSDEKGYTCGLCNIFMKNLNVFKLHMEQHEKYSCKICKLDFPVESEFEIHLEAHWDMTPTCDICDEICGSHKDLSTHFMKSHNLPIVYLKKCSSNK